MVPSDRQDALTALMPKLLRRARRLTRSPEAAEDLVQEALLRVWGRLNQANDIEDLEPYVMTALANIGRRPAPVHAELTEAEMPSTDPEAEARMATADVLTAIENLPDAQSVLLRDHAVNGVSYADLAAHYDLPIGTVMSRVARARAQLREDFDLPNKTPAATLLG